MTPLLRGLLVTSAVVFLAAFAPRLAHGGAAICSADCDASGFLDPADVELLVASVFEGDGVCAGIDANNDGAVGAPDLVALIDSIGTAICSTWIPLPPLPGGTRQEHAVAALDGNVYVIAGFVNGLISDLTEVYDIDTNTWGTAAPFPLNDAHHVAAVVADDKLYTVGVLETAGFTAAPNVYVYDPGDNQWTRLADLPTPRGALGAAHIDGRIYAVGGTPEADEGPSTERHDVYDIVANEWTELPPLPSPRDHLAVVAIGGKVYAVGGRNGLVNTDELDCYDPQTNQWEVLTPMPTARGGIAAAVLDGRLVVVGGEGFAPNKVFNEVEMYDPVTDEWTSLAPMAIPRHGMGAAADGGLMYVPGGAIRAGFGARDVFDALMVR